MTHADVSADRRNTHEESDEKSNTL